MLDCYAANGQRILATVPARPWVTELLFLGTHTPVDTTASRLTAWRNSAMPPHAELWQLLLHEDSASKPRTAAAAAAAGVAACAWTPSQLFARLPRLARSLSTNRAYQLEQTKYLRRCYCTLCILLQHANTNAAPTCPIVTTTCMGCCSSGMTPWERLIPTTSGSGASSPTSSSPGAQAL